MSSYSSSSSYGYQPLSPPSSYGYQPLSPPWSPHMTSPQLLSTHYDRAPAMPYVPLPPCDDEPHYGLNTPPPTPPRIHSVLAARCTVVRYDFAADPRTTLRMSSSSPYPIFPAHDAASRPSMPVLYIQCELTGHIITIHRYSSSGGATCGDVLTQLHRFFDEPVGAEEWRAVRGSQRELVKAAYVRRTGRVYDRTTAQLKKVDYLLGRSVFKCLVPKQNDASGSTWLLQTTSA